MLFLTLVQAGHDFYRILRIPRNATNAEIKRAHRKQSLRYHPDRALDAEEREQFAERQQLLNDAVDILLSKERREIYDKAQYLTGTGEEEVRRLAGNQGMPLDQALDAGAEELSKTHIREKADAWEFQLNLTFRQCMDGVFEYVSIAKTTRNPECHMKQHNCVYCGGTGKRPGRPELGPGELMEQRPCPFCNGLGHPYDNCDSQNMTVTNNRSVLAIAQAGVPTGYTITLDGEGSVDPTDLSLPAGDLKITINCENEVAFSGLLFHRVGQDLLVDIQISAEEAMLGFSRTVELPSGETVVVSLPRVVRDGERVVFNDKGLSSFEGSGKGKLVVSIHIAV